MNSTFTIDILLNESETVLKGRLTVAEASPLASVMLLPGGGLSDGDGNDTDLGFSPLAQWAEALADAGYNSLRFDRRGTGATGGDYVGPEAALGDVDCVLAAARAMPELPQPWIAFGLGEAAAWAASLCARSGKEREAPQFAGAVLISPPTGAIADVFAYRQQAEAVLAATPSDRHRKILHQLQAEYDAKSPLFLFPPIFDVTCPVLVLHGEMDWIYPVSCSRQLVAEVQKRDRGPQDLIYHELLGLDGWLIRTDSWRSPQASLQPHWRIDEGAVGILVNWLQQKFPP
ncbi:MAG: hypothetical protein AAFY57_13850 [Cyanobacteria bacterium J06642_2]